MTPCSAARAGSDWARAGERVPGPAYDRHMENERPLRDPLPPEAIAALNRGNKIEAIKIVRAALGVDLKDAKDLVDRHVAADPVMRLQSQTLQAAGRGSFRTAILLVVVIAALWWLYSR